MYKYLIAVIFSFAISTQVSASDLTRYFDFSNPDKFQLGNIIDSDYGWTSWQNSYNPYITELGGVQYMAFINDEYPNDYLVNAKLVVATSTEISLSFDFSYNSSQSDIIWFGFTNDNSYIDYIPYNDFWFNINPSENSINSRDNDSVEGGIGVNFENLSPNIRYTFDLFIYSDYGYQICLTSGDEQECKQGTIIAPNPIGWNTILIRPHSYTPNLNGGTRFYSDEVESVPEPDSIHILPYPLAEWDIVVAEPYYNEDDIYGYDVYFPQSKLIPFVFNTPDDVNRASSSIAIWETSGTSSTPIIIKNNIETDNFGEPYNGYIKFSIPIENQPKLYSAILIDEYGFFRSYYNFITKIGTTSPSYENYLLGKRMEKYRNDYCEGVATSTGTFLDDIRYSFECTAKKFVAWLFIPSDDIKNELSTSVKNLSNEFPISIMTGMRNLMYQSKLETSTSSARVYMGTFIYSGYTNAYDDVVFFDPEWIPQNLGEVWQLFYNAMTYIMWLGFAYYIFSRIFGVVSDEQEQEFIYTEQQELAYKGQFTGTGRAHRSKLKNINTRDKVRFYHK